MIEIEIGKNDAGQRLDRFLSKAYPRLNQALVQKLVRKKRIKRNDARCDCRDMLAFGDRLKLYLSDELLARENTAKTTVSAEIEVVYEDENIILVDKPAGLVVHEDSENTADTLINRITAYLTEKGEYNSENEQSFAPALCNRLDRNTCGIVVAAKNAESLRILNEKIRGRELQKRYLCLLAGRPPKKSDKLSLWLEKDGAKNRVFVHEQEKNGALTAVTEYRVLEYFDDFTLAEINLITGRTHQIRATMSWIGCPVLGDSKYGNNAQNRRFGLKKQALCAYKLGFDFNSDSGILSYLDGKSFVVSEPWFLKKFGIDIAKTLEKADEK